MLSWVLGATAGLRAGEGSPMTVPLEVPSQGESGPGLSCIHEDTRPRTSLVMEKDRETIRP